MCSNAELAATMRALQDTLKNTSTDVRSLRAELSAHRLETRGQAASQETWRKTVCANHADRIDALEDRERKRQSAVDRASGRAAVIGAGTSVALQAILGAVAAHFMGLW